MPNAIRAAELFTADGSFRGILRLHVRSRPERYREPYSVRREYYPDGAIEPTADVETFETRDAAEAFYRETVERIGRAETFRNS